MKKLALLVCFLCTLTLCADAVLVIKGKARRSALKRESQSGLGCDIRRYKSDFEVSFRPRKKFEKAKLVFRATGEDEFTFTFGGGYIRSEGNKKNVFEYIDCDLLRINGKDYIGPKVEQGGKKSDTLYRPAPLKGSLKVKKGDKVTIELSFRSTPKKEAKKLEAAKDPRLKEKMQREAERAKDRNAEKEREEKARLKAKEANERVLAERYGIKSKNNNKTTKSDKAEKAEESTSDTPQNEQSEEAPQSGGDQ